MELKKLYGTHVNLRPITMEDTPLIVKWRNNPNVQKNFIFRDTFTEEMHNRWMTTKVASGEVVQYIIEDAETDKPLGSVYLRDIDPDLRCAEIGIFIGEDDARGKGVGTESMNMMMNMGFDTLHLHRIFMRILAENMASRKMFERIHSTYEGTARDMVLLDGVYRDVVFMSKLDTDERG